jgi:hypothetical protein
LIIDEGGLQQHGFAAGEVEPLQNGLIVKDEIFDVQHHWGGTRRIAANGLQTPVALQGES